MLHTINPEILFLKQEDVIKAGLLDMKPVSYTHLTLPTIYSV